MKVVPKIHTTLATTNHLNALVVPEKVWSNKVQRDKLQAIAADSLDALSTLAANKSLNMAIHYAEMLRAEMKALGDADDLSNDQTTTTSRTRIDILINTHFILFQNSTKSQCLATVPWKPIWALKKVRI